MSVLEAKFQRKFYVKGYCMWTVVMDSAPMFGDHNENRKYLLELFYINI